MNGLADLLNALRQVRRQPAHAALVVGTLGLATALATVIFAFVSFFVLRPLPIRDEASMVLVHGTHPDRGTAGRPRLSYADFLEMRDSARTVEELVGVSVGTGALTGRGDARRVSIGLATESLLRVWDLKTQAGRLYAAADDRAGAAPVALLNDGYWEREFARDPRVVGSTVVIDEQPTTIVGILTPDIEIGRFAEIDLWMPLVASSPSLDRSRRDLIASGRLKPGVTAAQAAAEFRSMADGIAQRFPETNRNWSAAAIPMREGLYGRGTDVILSLLVVGVALVFAVACANVAGVMLARATTREREVAVRLSLGANRGAIARQLFSEGVVLSVLASVAGLALAQAALLGLRSIAVEQFYDLVRIDAVTVAAAAALALVAPVLFALAPALQVAGRAVAASLKDGGARGGASSQVGRARRGLVSLQIALGTALLLLAGLSVRAAVALQNFDLGFRADGLLSARIDFGTARYATDQAVRARVEELFAGVDAEGGPASSASPASWAIGSERPVFDWAALQPLALDGRENDPNGPARAVATSSVTDGYAATIGLTVLRGRDFARGDGPDAAPVALVNEAFVAKELPGRDPLGARIRVGAVDAPWREIVGVVSNIASSNIEDPPAPQVYAPFAQRPVRSIVAFARGGDAGRALDALRRAMRSLDPALPIYEAKTMRQVASEELQGNRIVTGLFVALGATALVLAAVGLYGMTAFLVAQRSREIGVRMALGASKADVVRMVVSQGARVTGAGLAIGLALGVALGRAMSSILFGVSPADPLTFAATLATLALVGVLAHWSPARRAATVNPVEALRSE